MTSTLAGDDPAVRHADSDGRTGRARSFSTPLWFERALVVVAATVVSWGGVGLFLADIGHYSLAAAGGVGSIGTLAGIALAVSWRRPANGSPSAQLPAVLMALVAVGFMLWNGFYVGHHVWTDRDPGVYLITGKWLAQHGTLIVPARTHWPEYGIQLRSAGMYNMPDGTEQFQFAHFLPSLLAEADNIGGDALMFRVDVVLGALALCMLYAVGVRATHRPWPVLLAVTGLSVSLPELYTTRDTFSEIATQFVLWAGILFVMAAIADHHPIRRLATGLLAGTMLGATMMTRIDGVAYLIMLPILAAIGWIVSAGRPRGRLLALYAVMLVGITVPATLGTLDVQRRSASYYAHLHEQVWLLYLAVATSVVVSVIAVALWPFLHSTSGWLTRHAATIARWAAGTVVVGLLLNWGLRPSLQHAQWPDNAFNQQYRSLIAGLQKAAGLPIDSLRIYSEMSMTWFSWYLGAVAVALAVVGAGVLVYRGIRNADPAATIALLIAGSLSVVYMWNDHVNPDQPWAMRRFMPATLPLLALLTAAGLALVVDVAGVTALDYARRRRDTSMEDRAVREPSRIQSHSRLDTAIPPRAGRRARRGVLALGAVALLAFPIGTTLPVRKASVYAGYSAAIEHMCAAVGDNAAVLYGRFGYNLTQTTRSWCDIPVAQGSTKLVPADITRMARAWSRAGRVLWVVGSKSEVARWVPGSRPSLLVAVASPWQIKPTLIRPPSDYVRASVTLYGARVPA